MVEGIGVVKKAQGVDEKGWRLAERVTALSTTLHRLVWRAFADFALSALLAPPAPFTSLCITKLVSHLSTSTINLRRLSFISNRSSHFIARPCRLSLFIPCSSRRFA